MMYVRDGDGSGFASIVYGIDAHDDQVGSLSTHCLDISWCLLFYSQRFHFSESITFVLDTHLIFSKTWH